MKELSTIFNAIKDFLNIHIVTIGGNHLTLWTIIYFLFLAFILLYFTKKLKNWIVHKLLKKSKIDIGVRLAVGTIIRYLILTLGFIIVIQTVGIDLSTLTILFGALGVGIGFGLQNITNNFVSGIIILFERPIKVGDRIELEDIEGDVIKISLRSTTIVTNDNISVIVPNSKFISSTIINWSHNDRNVRFNIPVGVSYGSDPEKVKSLLLEVAEGENTVLKNPLPDVIFNEFADSSLNFSLRVWTQKHITTPQVLKSKLYFQIFKIFKENGIEIPFPQRDVHLIEKKEIKN
ncbi:MAG: mechanosensitive ion channel family protein [Bacteroidetes bacterium]|nr:mechanosensitive ion channel family protein [Bacteroidota bacterium]